MRITNNMVINKMIHSLNNNRESMSKIQNKLATGKKISVPSDNPLIASRSLKYRSDISEIEQFQKNSEDALSWVQVTDNTLGTVGDVVQRSRELAVQASTDSNSASERKNIAEETEELYKQLEKLANTSYSGRYIFSGYNTDEPLVLEESESFSYTDTPIVSDGTNFRLRHDDIDAITNVEGEVGGAPTNFTIVAGAPDPGEVQVDTDTGELTFNAADVGAGIENVVASYSLSRDAGDYNPDAYAYSSTTQSSPMEDEHMKYEVGIGDKIQVNTLGTAVFGQPASSENIGEHMKNFEEFINALKNNNTDGIEQAIEDMDNFMSSVLEQRANVGARMNRLELTKNRLQEEHTNFSELMSKNEDADMSKVIMQLKNKENIYRSSLQVGARIMQPSLIDFLR